MCDGIAIGQKFLKKGLTVLLKWKELRNQEEMKGYQLTVRIWMVLEFV